MTLLELRGSFMVPPKGGRISHETCSHNNAHKLYMKVSFH